MSLDALDRSLELELEALRAEGRAKPPERVITAYLPPREGRGPATGWPAATGSSSA